MKLNLKQSAWRTYKNVKDDDAHGNFSKLKQEVKSDSKNCYSNYIRTIGADIKGGPNKFWSYINHQKSDTEIPNQTFYNKNCLNTSSDIRS